MQNKKFWLLAASLLLVVGCNNNASNNKLGKPQLRVNDEETGLTWAAVKGAESYEIQVNDGDPQIVQDPGYAFNTVAGEYSVSVAAVKGSKKSEAAVFPYTTEAASVGDLAVVNGEITWTAYAGKALEYKGGSVEEFTPVQGNSVEVTQNGIYSFRATKGFRFDNDHFYAADSEEKSIYAALDADTDLIIEDGSATSDAALAEGYTIKKNSNGDGKTWEDTTSTIVLDGDINQGISETKAVAFKYTYQGFFFKYEKEINIAKAYAGFSFAVKGDVDEVLSISFVITEHVPVNTVWGNFDLIGARLVYTLDPVPVTWTKYSLDFSEAGWTAVVEGVGTKTFAEAKSLLAAAGYSVNSMADLLPLCGSIQFRVKGKNPNTHNYVSCKTYVDDVKLLAQAPTSSIERLGSDLQMYSFYTFDAASVHGELDAAHSYVLTNNDGNGSTGSITVTIAEPANKTVRISSNVQGYDFDATFASDDGGKTLYLESVTGSLAGALAGAKAQAVIMLDDFESWNGQGQGYIQSNQRTDNLSGFRGAYYADWKTTDTSTYGASLINGTTGDYRLMGGDGSQVFLKEDNTMAFTGGKLMRLKINKDFWMRYTTSRVIDAINGDDDPVAYPHAKAITFMAKGTSANESAWLRVFFAKSVNGDNFNSVATIDSTLTIKASSNGWNRYTLALDQSKTYYGWSLALANSSNNQGTYISIDSVALVL